MRVIAHIDMDAFFAAIEQRDEPDLLGKPVIIGADPKKGDGRGVVSTCSYEAREYGIRSAMPITKAYRLCPHGVFLPGNMAKYKDVAAKIYRIFEFFTPIVEPISIDEAFLDLTGSIHFYEDIKTMCLRIKKKIVDEVNLIASIGIAPTKMLAKIASDIEKPDGLVIVGKTEIMEFLSPLDISKMWGIGRKTKEILNTMGIFTIGDIARRDVRELTDIFGKAGFQYWMLANGKDDRLVEKRETIKSVSNEKTFERDILDIDRILSELLLLSDKVGTRLRMSRLKGTVITLKIRLSDFRTFTRNMTLSSATNYTETIYKISRKLFNELDTRGLLIRLIGVKVSSLIKGDRQTCLFVTDEEKKIERLYGAIDRIKEKFGKMSIKRGY